MKKLFFIFCLLALIMGCSNENRTVSELMRVADFTKGSVDVTEIYDKKEINKINEITNSLEWVDEAIETNGNPDYSFWLERKGVELRVKNYEIWFNQDKSVILDHVTVKYAFINGVNMDELKNLLESSALN
ncbi:hypothetical protein BVG16_31130 [Paenibacillus selenitireducens]|uniref:Lipoprotein n=1 Tax=Paenibacillus selenitireducens TaxID=1324314 RepID=A0A1T2WZF5_9BACL|nr:hypothetical protein [Paenibacillus selenitireducens]OPA73010.1 hypothetical protein BVG16_31130 [Paenibacillus selenitireducens]